MTWTVKRTAIAAVLWVLAIVVMMSACQAFEPVAEHVVRAVDRYCAEPYTTRLLMRETVNARLGGHRIMVHCAGDPSPADASHGGTGDPGDPGAS